MVKLLSSNESNKRKQIVLGTGSGSGQWKFWLCIRWRVIQISYSKWNVYKWLQVGTGSGVGIGVGRGLGLRLGSGRVHKSIMEFNRMECEKGHNDDNYTMMSKVTNVEREYKVHVQARWRYILI